MTEQIAINKKRSPKGIPSSQGAFVISNGPELHKVSVIIFFVSMKNNFTVSYTIV